MLFDHTILETAGKQTCYWIHSSVVTQVPLRSWVAIEMKAGLQHSGCKNVSNC